MISRLKKIGRDFSLLLSAHTTQDKAIARNWIWHEDISTFWIKKYIDLKFPEHKKVCFFSCFDPRIRLAQFYPGVKIFYSGENLQSDAVRPGLPAAWRDARIAEVDLSIGFEFRKEPNYYRFPFWICHRDFIQPDATLEDIRAFIAKLNDPKRRLYNARTHQERTRFISLIASHDLGGVRTPLIKLLSPIGQIDCAGKFMNNTDELRTKFGDVKEDFLANYRFNLCPENSLGEGYITEKIFESIASGCIPIYWGDYLEPGILNPKAILRYKVGEEAELYERVKELWENEDAYRRFAAEPPFVEGAAERIWEYIQGLHERLAKLL